MLIHFLCLCCCCLLVSGVVVLGSVSDVDVGFVEAVAVFVVVVVVVGGGGGGGGSRLGIDCGIGFVLMLIGVIC